MTSWSTGSFPPRHDHDTDRRASWTISQRLGRQNAFIIEPNDPYNPFDSLNIQLSDDSSSSSFSSIHSAVSKTLVDDNHTDTLINQQQRPFSRAPMPQNTADYDEPPCKIARASPVPAETTTTIQRPSFTWPGKKKKKKKISGRQTIWMEWGYFTWWLVIIYLDRFYFMLKKASLFLALSVIYQAFSCTELQPMPTERLYAVDPDAPTHVWVPVRI